MAVALGLSKREMERQYLREGKSMQDLARFFNCSLHKVSYWMLKYNIPIRPRSEATYVKRNPDGDPFTLRSIKMHQDSFLMGLGVGLYWGEGTKANKNSIRLGNTDPFLIKKFIEFLIRMYGIEKGDLKFGLQIFSDIQPEKALKFWLSVLKVSRSQFQKIIVTPSRARGTYRKKLEHGVLTVHYNNKKLRDVLNQAVEKLHV
jgi:hypothetical protein